MTRLSGRIYEMEHHAADRVTTRPVVSGTQGIVASGHPLVSMAGMRMLLSGGNASDAGVVAGFAAVSRGGGGCQEAPGYWDPAWRPSSRRRASPP